MEKVILPHTVGSRSGNKSLRRTTGRFRGRTKGRDKNCFIRNAGTGRISKMFVSTVCME